MLLQSEDSHESKDKMTYPKVGYATFPCMVKYVKAIKVPAWKHKQGSFQGVSPLHLAEEQWKDALHRSWYLVSPV
jgi:hypothetical protein